MDKVKTLLTIQIIGIFTGVFLMVCFLVGYMGIKIPNPRDSFNYLNPRKPGFYIIYSGSMQPSIKTGSITINISDTSYEIGDVIVFGANSKDVVTHRIVEKEMLPSGEFV